MKIAKILVGEVMDRLRDLESEKAPVENRGAA